MRCVCGCKSPPVVLHHPIRQQVIRRYGGDPGDRRSMVPIAQVCHERHHSGARRIPLARLPDELFEFAEELMGPGPAYNELERQHAGDPGRDARMRGLLERWEAQR